MLGPEKDVSVAEMNEALVQLSCCREAPTSGPGRHRAFYDGGFRGRKGGRWGGVGGYATVT